MARVCWKFIQRFAVCYIFRPAWKLFIDWFAFIKHTQVRWVFCDQFSLIAVSRTNLHRLKSCQYVDRVDSQIRQAANASSVADNNAVEPADAARTGCCRAVFLADCTDRVADLIKLFCRERAVPYTRSIGFTDADHVGNHRRSNTRSDGNTTGNRVG